MTDVFGAAPVRQPTGGEPSRMTLDALDAFNLDFNSDPDGSFDKLVEVQDEEPFFFDSFFSAFGASNSVVQSARALGNQAPKFTPRDGYNVLNDLFDESNHLSSIRSIVEEDDAARDVLLMAQSPEEAEFLANQIRTKYEQLATAFENPVAGVAGMLAGGIFDVATALPIIGQAKYLRTAVNTLSAARKVASARTALLASTDATAFGVAESFNDPTVDFTDILSYSALGAVIGAGVGRVIKPGAVGVDVVPGTGFFRHGGTADDLQEAAARMSTQSFGPRSVGAGAVVELDDEATKALRAAAGPDKIRDVAAPIGGDRLSPVGRAQTMSAQSKKKLAPKGYTASDKAFTLFNKMVDNRAQLESEVEGVARATNAFALNDRLIGMFRSQDSVIQGARKEAEKVLNGTWSPRPTQSFGVVFRLPRPRMGQREWFHLVDNFRHARHNGDDTDVIWLESMDLADDEKARILPMLEKAANARNKQADTFLDELLERGMVSEKELKKGKDGSRLPYTPQLLDMEEVNLDPAGFKQMLRMFLVEKPMDEFLIQRGFVEGVEEIAPDGTKVTVPATSFDDLDDAIKEEAFTAWSDEMVRLGEINAERMVDEARKMAGMKQKAAMSIVVAKQVSKVRRLRDVREFHAARYQKKIAEIERVEGRPNFQNSATHEQRYKTVERAIRLQRKVEQELDTTEEHLRFILSRRRSIDDTQEFINKVARNTPKVRKLSKQIAKQQGKAEKIETDLATGAVGEKFDFEKALDDLVDKILDPRNPGGAGWIPEGPIARLLPKQFDISSAEKRYHPLVQRFYNWDLEQSYANYERTVLPRVAMHDALRGKTMQESLSELKKDFTADIKAARLAGDNEEAELLTRHRDTTIRDLEDLERRFKGAPDEGMPSVRYLATQIKRFSVVNMLGSVALALPGDLAMADMASGQLGRGIKALMTSPGMRRTFKDLEDMGEDTLRAIVTMSEDVRSMDMRTLKFADVDTYHNVRAIGGPRTLMREASKMVDRTSEGLMSAMMRVNGMRAWNLYLRAGVGHLFMEQTLNQMPNFRKLPANVRAEYARRGIDEATADRIAALFKKHGTIKAGRRTFPAFGAMEKEDPTTMAKYHIAVRGVIRDSIPEGELGQSPLLASTPIGSVWLQFLTFPMMAKQIMGRVGQIRDPRSVLFIGAATQALLYASLGDWARHALRGESDEWLARSETTEGWTQNLYTAWVRSPLASGLQSPLLELITKAASSPVNELLEQQGIAPLFPGSGKFKDANVLSVLAGPTGTQIKRTYGLINTGLGVVSDPDKQETLIRQGIHAAPFASHPIFRMLEAAHYEEFD